MPTPEDSFSCVSTPRRSSLGCPALSPSRLGPPPKGQPYAVRRPIHMAAGPSFHGPSPRSNVVTAGWESSPTVHRLRLWGLALGSASPCADCHGAGILGLPVSEVFTLICAYSFRHPHFPSLHPLVSTGASPHGERSPTPHSKNEGQASAGRLIPTILGAFTLDQ